MTSPFTGPGVFWISSNTNDESVFSYADFARWYEDVHIPDMIHADPANPLPVARRYQALSPTERPFLVVYKMPDLAFVVGEAFRKVPLHHETLPEDGPIAKFAHFRGRFAKYGGAWGRPGPQASLLLSEITEDTSYEEYMGGVQSLPGWLRSSQYTIVLENEIGGDKPPPTGPPTPGSAPTMTRRLTLHEFDIAKTGGDLAEGRVASRPTTLPLISAEVDTEVKVVEVLAYKLVRTYGDEALLFADIDEK
ncbi:hypothetical protein SEUCBS139899_006635 [Sporothrix eucalyptigena]|uniref:Acetoacetate decarboxylase n=1 Tax=Sporothrix eucalyptigena TaxID=1812306 RepID=A0ABP0B2W4_9PEZI